LPETAGCLKVGPTVDICKSVNLFCLTRKTTEPKTKQNKAKPKTKKGKKKTENASAKQQQQQQHQQQQQKHADRALQQQL
jgi:Mg-chelatase subunit ChlI